MLPWSDALFVCVPVCRILLEWNVAHVLVCSGMTFAVVCVRMCCKDVHYLVAMCLYVVALLLLCLTMILSKVLTCHSQSPLFYDYPLKSADLSLSKSSILRLSSLKCRLITLKVLLFTIILSSCPYYPPIAF